MSNYSVVERGTIFSDHDPSSDTPVACYPTLARLSDGRILCTFRIGKAKDGADESLRIAESCDEGKTWSLTSFVPDTTLDGKVGSVSMGSVIETAPGQLLMVSTWIDRSDPSRPITNPETGGLLDIRSVKFHSSDNGATWTSIEAIKGIPFPQPEISGPVIALGEPGHLLLPMENQKTWDDPAPIDEKCYALLSFDGGHTWPEWAMVAHDHPARKFWCNRIARQANGKLVAASWTFDNATEQDLPLHLVHGSPDGRQWSAPISTGVEGQVSHLLPLPDGALLMATSHRQSPAGIRLRTSHDNGQTWDGDGLLVLDAENQAVQSGGDLTEYYKQMTGYTFGWSPMVVGSDGSILLAHFAGNSEQIGIYYARIAGLPVS